MAMAPTMPVMAVAVPPVAAVVSTTPVPTSVAPMPLPVPMPAPADPVKVVGTALQGCMVHRLDEAGLVPVVGRSRKRGCGHQCRGQCHVYHRTHFREQAAEIKRLKRELARVTEERTILKKATAYFARESQ